MGKPSLQIMQRGGGNNLPHCTWMWSPGLSAV
jgi:hypothetical protein